jgi:hypothetical protein
MTKINCKECGVAFQPTRDWQEFCQTKCRKDFNNRKDREEIKAARRLAYAIEVDGGATLSNGVGVGYSPLANAGRVASFAPKKTLSELGLASAQPLPQVHRRKLAAAG